MCHYSEQVEWEAFEEAIYAAESAPGDSAASDPAPAEDGESAGDGREPVPPTAD